MKKVIVLVLMLTLCLCGCGAGEALEEALSGQPEEIVLPTKPQIAAPSLPGSAAGSSEAATEESAGTAGETCPREAEFNKDGYEYFEEKFSHGKIVSWHKNFMPGRQITYWNDGRVHDTYFYPSGNTSHEYLWEADGLYIEVHYLDNGYIETKEDGAMVSHIGTKVYEKIVSSDGSWGETHFDENEIAMFSVSMDADGTYRETHYFQNGDISRDICDAPSGEHNEYEYYEDGSTKYSKSQSSEYTIEERYDMDGYRTYYHSKDAGYEIELISDDTGRLVKVIENGTVIEDAAALAQYAPGYNFRQ